MPLSLKCWHFESSEDIITKFKSQGLHIKRIKCWNASGSGSPPSLIPALCNIGILLHKQATRIKHFCPLLKGTTCVLNVLYILLDKGQPYARLPLLEGWHLIMLTAFFFFMFLTHEWANAFLFKDLLQQIETNQD